MTDAIDITINDIIKNPDGAGEGCSLNAYWDAAGNCWTIGYGCTGQGITEGTTWTQSYAEDMLRQRVTDAYNEALKASPILADQSADKQAAITDLIYNLGLDGYVGHSLKPLIDAGNWQAAAQEIKLFCHAGGQVEPGLVKRRALESALLLQ